MLLLPPHKKNIDKRFLNLLYLVLFPFFLKAQTGKVSGVIYDSLTKSPLAFVSITVKDSKAGAVTDI